ncbi:Bgt-1330 [Blumeria graminis f. sp. tritici]|uniref:assimilatory sulfite reductase (NADPH) n=2 Tax=Blumeria graminis f. sp. tritici TaxID=62690 RepID=A0A061HBQ0_BLUGR|nr:Subunit alpha of assimilatory sulfite reductase [Blumeria graminis f. sp. tritici 96224]VDB87880.1 Bgt-1330 [Blumeria graminis f. sp. tritici]
MKYIPSDTSASSRVLEHGSLLRPKKNIQETAVDDTPASTRDVEVEPYNFRKFSVKSPSLPFNQPIKYNSISKARYLTTQTLIQQVAYTFSDSIFCYSPESFDLDVAIKAWAKAEAWNVGDYVPNIHSLQTRSGAGAIILGYISSQDFDETKRHIPQALIASSASLLNLYSCLDQLSQHCSVTNPFVAHIAAVDYAPGASSGLVTDYTVALNVAEEFELGLVSSCSAFEAQHMALFSTILSTILPTIHVYDVLNMGYYTMRVTNVLDSSKLSRTYNNACDNLSTISLRADNGTRVMCILNTLNYELGTAYNLFEYRGHGTPETVLVVFGSVESSLSGQVSEKLSAEGNKVGVISVRVYRPFAEDAFINTLPSSVKTIAVLGQVSNDTAVADASLNSKLFEAVMAAVVLSDGWVTQPSVVDLKYSRSEVFTPASIAAYFPHPTGKALGTRPLRLLGSDIEQYIFFDIEDSASSTAPTVIGKLLSIDSPNNVAINQTYDNLIQGGTIRTDIRSSKRPFEAFYPIEEADVVYVGHEKLLSAIDIVKNIKLGGKLILKLPNVKDGEVQDKLPNFVMSEIKLKDIQLFLLDPSFSGPSQKDAAVETMVVEMAFLQVTRPELADYSSEKLALINGNVNLFQEVSCDLEKIIRPFKIPEMWADIEVDQEVTELPWNISATSFTGIEKKTIVPALTHDYQSTVKSLVFKEAYDTRLELKPGLAVKTYEITVKENRRLTPLAYDRNIFHIEFDLGASGLIYNIGESICVHAENNVKDVAHFISKYSLHADDIVKVSSHSNPSILVTRTIYQSLVQDLDIFGKPSKNFYQVLAGFASSEIEKKELLALAGPEGSAKFKRRAEVEAVTFADLLLEFKSAHPSFKEIIQIVPPLKRREYSIASCQSVSPDRLALMVVIVSWVDPRGRIRYGQASHYLSELSIGAKVVVSLKPSVMKLPVINTVPLILTGLGTGIAPFRAFVQYRAQQKSQGNDTGPILLYIGSRRQHEEYLYGEEWEAYHDSGVITYIGQAFSHDQPQKMYIHDRMRQSMQKIVEAYIRDEGVFYLSGPTWPVPEITKVLREAISMDAKISGRKIDPRKEIERLKGESRYVLQVY